ncbi:uncharacterized protein E0L32_011155 [Thyridium curvatum]|uniref:Uncharacterized protein n=1 Tax=Thyridium curvatum TaxID=1093900 RepID=A0A507AQ14_9PEZI|nr:uncharacterized protein E0L32_011155 [Thyridium curvatum]TPX06931.1 hypothetical protein E0L32_011155 [Thyridium curvatum]
MAKGLDELVEWLIAEISYSGETGFSVDDFISATSRYYTGKWARPGSSDGSDPKVNQDHDGAPPAVPGSNGTVNLARKAWPWVVMRDEVSVGHEKAWNHLPFDSLLALPKEGPPMDPALAAEDTSLVSSETHSKEPTAKASKSSGESDIPLVQPRIYVSEEAAWVAITGHGPDYKRIPLLEWRCLLGIASAGREGIIQGDLRQLVNQDKRSVPKRTDFLAAKGYIEKRTIIARATKTSKLWITKFAPPELTPVRTRQFGQAQGFNLTQDFLTKDLDPVPWCDRWTGSSIDHPIFSQTALAIVRAWNVMRLTDLKMKMGIHGQKWQMRVLARTFRRLATMGLVRYVAAMLPGRRQVLKDCVKWIREPTEEEWAEHLATGTKHSQYSDHSHDRQPKDIVAAAGAQKPALAQNAEDAAGENAEDEEDEQILPAIRSPWDIDKPFANQVFEEVKRAGPRGATNPMISTATIGFAFRRYIYAWLQQAANRNCQPAHLRHFQIQSQLVRIGKTEAYVFAAKETSQVNNPADDNTQQDQEMPIDEPVQIASSTSASFRFSALPSFISSQADMPSLSDLSLKLASKHRPVRQYRRARTALPEHSVAPGAGVASSPVEAVAHQTENEAAIGVEAAAHQTENEAARGEESEGEKEAEIPPEPKPIGAFLAAPGSLDLNPRRQGRPRKSVVILVRLEQLKDPEFLIKRRGAETTTPPQTQTPDMDMTTHDEAGAEPSSSKKRKAEDRASGEEASDPAVLNVETRYNGAKGTLVFCEADRTIRFEATAADGSEPLVIKIDDLASDPTTRDAPGGDDKALVLNAREGGSDAVWPYIFLLGNTPEAREKATSFQEAVIHARIQEKDATPVDEEAPEAGAEQDANEDGTQPRKGRPRGKKNARKGGAASWKCDQCGGTWKNDVGLKYHLTKSKTSCNKDYVPETIFEDRPRKRQKVQRKLYELGPSFTEPPTTARAPAPVPAPALALAPAQAMTSTPAPAPTPGPAQLSRSLRSNPEKIASKPQRHLMTRKSSAINMTSLAPRGFMVDIAQPPDPAQTPMRRTTPPPIARPTATEQRTRLPVSSKPTKAVSKQIEVISVPQTSKEPANRAQAETDFIAGPNQTSHADMMFLDPRLRGIDRSPSVVGHRNSVQDASPSGANQRMPVGESRQPLGEQPLTSNIQLSLSGQPGGLINQDEDHRLDTSSGLYETPAASQDNEEPYDQSEFTSATFELPCRPPPFFMPAGRDLARMTASQVRIHQSEEIIKYFLEHNGGVFPAQQALWFAVITTFLKAFPEENPPRKSVCTRALNKLIKKKMVSEHVFGFRHRMTKIVHVRILVKTGVSPNGPVAKALKEKMQAAYPRNYIPPAFSPNEEDLKALEDMEPDLERDKNVTTQRAIAEEIEVLAAPFYERQSPRKRRAADDEGFPLHDYDRSKRRADYDIREGSPPSNNKMAPRDCQEPARDVDILDMEGPDVEDGQEGLHYADHWEYEDPSAAGRMSLTNAFKRYHLTSRRHRRKNHLALQEVYDFEAPSSPRSTELDERIEEMFNEPLLKFSRPQIGGSSNLPQVNLTFLEPNAFLEDDPEQDSSISRSPTPVEGLAGAAGLPVVLEAPLLPEGPAVPQVPEMLMEHEAHALVKTQPRTRKTKAGKKRGLKPRVSFAQEGTEETPENVSTIHRAGALSEDARTEGHAGAQDAMQSITSTTTAVGPWTETIVLQGASTSSTAVPNLPNSYFEENCEMSFTLKGWQPDLGFILRSHLPQSLADIGAVTRGFFRRNVWADPDWADFNQKVDGCLKWELSQNGMFLLSIPAPTTEYFFMNFDAPRVTDPNPSQPINLEWAGENQFTMRTIPYQALIEESGKEPDIEDYEDWNISTKTDHKSPSRRKPGRPRGSRSKTRRRIIPRARRRGTRVSAPKLPVFRKTREHTTYPHYPEDHFQDMEEMDDVDWKADDTRIAAFVAVRTLLGGVDKVPDWGVMLRIFPDSKISNLRQFWVNIKKERQLYIDSLTAKFQEAFLEAYEKNEVAPLDYDNVLAYDWRRLVSWTTKLVVNDAQLLPAKREVVQKEYSIVKSAARGGEWQERYYQNVRSVWKRFQDATSEAAAFSLEPEAAGGDLSTDDTIARSWLRALCRTPPAKYSPDAVRAALLKLGERTDREINELLNTALKALRNNRVIKQTKINTHSTPDRPYQFSDHWINQLDKQSQREKFIQAGQFKTHLDECFRNGKAYDIPYSVDDGAILVLINLQAHGRIRIEPVGLEDMTFGFDPGNYESRKYPKEYYHFDTRAVPTDLYRYNEDIEDVVCRADGVQRPGRGPRGELGVWCDFFGQVAPEPWVKVMGAVVFSIATRGSMDASQLSSALKPLVEPFEAGMILDWAVRAGILAAPVQNKGWTTKEWWWLVVAREYERMEGAGFGTA